MAEYIEREALYQAITKLPNVGGCSSIDRESVEIAIMQAPEADVVEVKHGEWLQTKEPLGYKDVDCIECSACRDSWVIDEDFDFEFHKQYWNYCPNCGARMDGKDINVPAIDGRSETNAE